MIRHCLATCVLLVVLFPFIQAQNLTSSPYSRYGIGEVFSSTTTRNAAMGEIGVATMNYASVNRINPASYADVLYTGLDISGFAQLTELQTNQADEDQFSAGFQNIGFVFPSNKAPAVSFGFAPFSGVGYEILDEYEFDFEDTVATGVTSYTAEGGLNQAYLGIATKFLKSKLSVGANLNYVFGTIRYRWQSFVVTTDLANFQDIRVDRSAFISGVGYQLGFIYADTLMGRKADQKIFSVDDIVLFRIGGVVEAFSNLNSDRTTSYANLSVIDTIGGVEEGVVVLPPKYSVGASVTKPGKWEVSGEFSLQDWTRFEYFDDELDLNSGYRAALGAEYIPDRTSNSYLKRIALRIGGYSGRTYLSINDEPINDNAVTVGFGFPASRKGTSVFNRERAYSQISLSASFGRRGSLKNGQPLQENYIRIRLGVNINERWFRRVRID
ncbi:MAG: hypothetical protein AAGI38_19585 [Bacteroidota bacterium]